jgi:NADPH:quinone reductase-like Zn-dependent oxidoreductase
MFKTKFPFILGFDYAGIVEEAGPKSGYKVGDEVYGRINSLKDNDRGCYAQYYLSVTNVKGFLESMPHSMTLPSSQRMCPLKKLQVLV